MWPLKVMWKLTKCHAFFKETILMQFQEIVLTKVAAFWQNAI